MSNETKSPPVLRQLNLPALIKATGCNEVEVIRALGVLIREGKLKLPASLPQLIADEAIALEKQARANDQAIPQLAIVDELCAELSMSRDQVVEAIAELIQKDFILVTEEQKQKVMGRSA